MIAITRFDNKTYRENRDWREGRSFNGTIYGSPIRISESILPDIILFVLEMNNSTNKIMGIGMIRAGGSCDGKGGKRCRIYKDNNYNRFIYCSDYRIDFENIYLSIEFHKKIIILEQLLFSGSRHCKRGQGIQLLPQWIKNINSLAILDDIRSIFRDKNRI